MAEREEKRSANFQKLQADLIKQIKRLTARLSEQERKHAREIAELKDKTAPTSEIIGYGTSKTDYRIVPFKSNGRPGASINLRPLFERYTLRDARMSRNLKVSDKKKLQRIFLQGRNRGLAAAQRRMREEREQEELDQADYEPPRYDDDE